MNLYLSYQICAALIFAASKQYYKNVITTGYSDGDRSGTGFLK